MIACAAVMLVYTYRNGHRDGFAEGRRFILFVMRQISPEAASRFADDMEKQYGYDIFSEIRRK